jgi:nucleoside-diphosphate-sugar epimerase
VATRLDPVIINDLATLVRVRVLVVGVSGVIGKAVAQRLRADHEVIGLTRRSEPPADLANAGTIRFALEALPRFDAVVCCAADAPLTALTDDRFVVSLTRN